MQVFRGLPRMAARRPCALTIGNFDGVHRGHLALLARVAGAASARGIAPAVMTFEPHPRELFAPQHAPPRIASLRDKLEAMRAAGIERVIVQHFDENFASQSPAAFIATLVDGCRARWLLVGDDFRFGARRAGDFALLAQHAARGEFELEQMSTVAEGSERISSSAIRDALGRGDLVRAAHLLGRPYAMSGHVLHGRKLGRELGFPTLNLRIARHPALQGICAVRVHGLGAPRDGVASIGQRPTVDAIGRWHLEVHLFDYDSDTYGRCVRVEFVRKLRDEQHFATLDQLRVAIADDAARARVALAETAAG